MGTVWRVTGDLEIRVARPEDDAGLVVIDVATCTLETSPAPPPDPATSFFATTLPGDTLVAELDGALAGYAKLGPFYALATSAHVLELRGFAVAPAWQRHGVGRRLLAATVTEARGRGARKLMLRVLGSNEPARRLYASGGFAVEAVLREQFLLGGRYVDDVLMAQQL